jgi:hypothetical protein
MIHNYSQWVGGKGNDITNQVKYTETYFRKLSKAIYGDFLTEDELEAVLSGKDIWMESDDVAARLKDKLIVQDQPEPMDEIIKSLIPDEIKVDDQPIPPATPVGTKKVAAKKVK